jgi:hypothetical protein
VRDLRQRRRKMKKKNKKKQADFQPFGDRERKTEARAKIVREEKKNSVLHIPISVRD